MTSWLLQASLVLVWSVAVSEGAGSFFSPRDCFSDFFFDTAGQLCSRCNNNAEPDTNTAAGGYGSTSCVCDAGFALNFAETAVDDPLDLGTCLECPQGTVPSVASDYCVRCDSTSGDGWSPARINSAGTACECTNPTQSSVISQFGLGGALLRDDDGTFMHRCVQCEDGSRPDPSSFSCVPCMYPMIWNGERCTCPDTLPEGSRCALTDDAWDSLIGRGAASFQTTFRDVLQPDGSVRDISVERSAVMTELLESSTTLCFEKGNTTACNALGNLCALQMHELTASPCILYQELVDLRSDEQYHEDELFNVGWSITLPWLYYPRGQANTYLFSTDVNTRVKLEGENEPGPDPVVRTLSFKVARYALDGRFLGWKNFTSMLQICGGHVDERNIWNRFGTNYKNDCEVPLTTILDIGDSTDQPVFVDLYFEDGQNRMYPVPLILENLDANQQALSNNNINGLQLTRRFFLVDTVSGLQFPAGPNSQPAAVRYLEKLSLEVVLQPVNRASGENGRIYPPRAMLKYASRDPDLRYDSKVVNPASFQVTYAQGEEKMRQFLEAWDYMIIAAMMAAIIVGLLKIFRFMKNQRGAGGDNSGEVSLIIEFVVVGLDVGSAACFFVLLAICVYWVCFFKLQSSVYTMLPMDEGEVWYRFRVSVICTTVGRVATVLWMVWKQTSVDIFFIDWTEAPRRINEATNNVELDTISCWRSLFVANEWNEIQTLRITSLELTMFSVIFLLSGLNIENGAKINPDSRDLTFRQVEETSQLLRFGISSSLFVLVQIVQYLFVRLVIYYKIKNPIVDFVDLLWLSNISMFVMDGVSGYYLHGQFSGPNVDTDAENLNLVLLGTQGNRGLVDNNDVQTFMIFISDSLREAYDRFRRAINDKYQQQREQDTIDYALRGPREAGGDKRLRAECDNVRERFMSELVEIQREPSSHVRDPGYFSRWTKLPPDDAVSKTVFWTDPYRSFTDILFYGNELSLFMMQVMVFACIDMRLRNAAFSGAITYLIMWTVGYLRNEWGENNLSQKALIDKRFLI